MNEDRREHESVKPRSRGETGADATDTATGASETRRADARNGKHPQQANPGDVEPGHGDGRNEPNPGNRKVSGDREQVDLPVSDARRRRPRDVDRGTH